MNEHESSEAERAWIDLTQSIRQRLFQVAKTIPTLTATELDDFMSATERAFQLELNAQIFDSLVTKASIDGLE